MKTNKKQLNLTSGSILGKSFLSKMWMDSIFEKDPNAKVLLVGREGVELVVSDKNTEYPAKETKLLNEGQDNHKAE